MKLNASIFYGMLLLPCLAHAQSAFTLKGRVGTLGKPAKAYLVYRSNDQAVRDSANLVNGVFEFHGKVSYATPATLTINHDDTPLRKIKSPDEISIYVEPKSLQMSPADSVKFAVVQKSAVNNENETLKKMMAPVEQEYNQLFWKLAKLPREQQTSGALNDSIRKQMKLNRTKRTEVAKEFFQKYPNSLVSLKVLQELAGPIPDADKVMAMFNGLGTAVTASVPGKQYKDYLTDLSRLSIGKMAPVFSQPDTAGNVVTLQSFKGKYVLIDFWASWCGPCRAENPNVVKNYAKYHDKGLEILGVSLDRAEDKALWMAAIHKDGLTWPQVSDLKFWKNEAAMLYGVKAIPQNFLVDPEGRIVAKNLRAETLDQKLADLLK